MSSWTPVEFLWVVVAVSTLAVGLYLLRQAVRDRSAVALRDGKARALVANGNVRRELGHVTTQALLLATGLLAGIVPPPVTPEVVAGNALTAVALVIVQLVVLASAIADMRGRAELLALAVSYIRIGPLDVTKAGNVVTVEPSAGALAVDVDVKEVGGTAVVTPVNPRSGDRVE